MPILTGTSVKGRQVLAAGIPAGTNVFVSNESQPTAFQYSGFISLELKENSGSRVWQLSGKSMWYGGSHLGTPGAIAGTTFQATAFWDAAGINWRVAY